jgi:hypothetical protein
MNEPLAYYDSTVLCSCPRPLVGDSYCTVSLFAFAFAQPQFATSVWWITRCHLQYKVYDESDITASASFRDGLVFRDPAKTGDIYSIRTKVAFLGGKTVQVCIASETRRARFSLRPSTTHTRSSLEKCIPTKAARSRCGHCRDRYEGCADGMMVVLRKGWHRRHWKAGYDMKAADKVHRR